MLPAMPTPDPRDFSAAPAQGPSITSTQLWTLAALAVVLAWDAGALDLAMARWFGDADGFALRSDWFFVNIAHEGARRMAWLVVLGLTLCVWRPIGPLRLAFAKPIRKFDNDRIQNLQFQIGTSF